MSKCIRKIQFLKSKSNREEPSVITFDTILSSSPVLAQMSYNINIFISFELTPDTFTVSNIICINVLRGRGFVPITKVNFITSLL
jgi:hypothetical protein